MPMTTLLESKAKPYGTGKGAGLSLALHAALITGAIVLTGRTVAPSLEKPEEQHLTYVEAPPPKAPEPAPLLKEAPRVAKVAAPKAPVVKRVPAPAPKPVAAPKLPTTPPLVAPVKIATSIPAPDLTAAPTVSDVVAPPSAGADELRKGTVRSESGGDVEGGSAKGLGSGSSGKAYSENQVDKAVELVRASTPRYPDQMRSAGIEGNVTVRYIVDASGKVEPGSIEILDTPNPAFNQAIRTALLNSRYRAAEAGGSKVRQLVEQSFTFRLDRQ